MESVLTAVQSAKGTHVSIEREGAKIKAGPAERSGIPAARRSHPKAGITHGEHEGNSQMMVLASSIKQMRAHRSAPLVGRMKGR